MVAEHDVNTPFYDLIYVKSLVRRGEYRINEDVSDKAYESLGWDDGDIRLAILDLKPEGFQASRPSMYIPGARVDSYTGIGRNDENYYTHFYIHPEIGLVIINSCKRDNRRRRINP